MRPASEAPEHDWAAAATMLFPALRPPGTHGLAMADVDRTKLAIDGIHAHAQPLVDPGPADLVVVYVLRTGSFDIIVNADHLVSWHIEPETVRAAAMDNLRVWSGGAAWREELAGGRRLLASDSGEGCDAARILLPEVRDYLATQLGTGTRVLVGAPDRDLLVAGALREEDPDFATQFGDFLADLAAAADEPIDPRVFELVEGDLVPLVAHPA